MNCRVKLTSYTVREKNLPHGLHVPGLGVMFAHVYWLKSPYV